MTISGEEGFNLSCGQRWLLHLLEQVPDLARPVQRIYRLDNNFNSALFLEALRCTVASHPALRLQLVRENNGWKQRFPDQDVNVSGDDLQGRMPEMRAAYAGMLIAEEGKRPMDLQKDSPVKARIIKVNGDCLLSLCVDHLAADEIAFDLFERTLLLSYQQLNNGSTISLAVPETFFNYLAKETARQAMEENNLLYWQRQLKDTSMPGDVEEKISWAPASVVEYQVTDESFQGLLHFCRLYKCSLFNLVVACELWLLADIGKINDIVLNIPVSNRVRADERSVIANLSMLLHLRFIVTREESVPQFVIRVRDQILSAMAHRQYDYASLSGFIVAEAKQNGVNTSWLCGCNFITDHSPTVFPNVLFAERLDNIPGRSYDIPRTSFSVTARQTESMLSIGIDWDAGTWPVTVDQMQVKFLEILHRFLA
jgi:hypothetical protein